MANRATLLRWACMILRDPVHGLIAFEGDAERVVSSLLATRELQRLRRVRQLGLASLVFPGAEHSRFSHAIGTAWLMVRLQDRVRAREGDLPPEARLTAEDARDALAAALLHDLGHGPYSHLFEEVTPGATPHERWGVAIVNDPDTDVRRALEGLSAGMASRVASLLEGTHPIGWLARSVSGALDVDRLDYLLRDSHMTGVRYGLLDVDWMLRALRFAELPNGEWVLAIEGRKGLPPFEAYFLGRHFMYEQVYHHKATRAAELLLRGIFRRVAELTLEGRTPEALPPALEGAVLGREVSVGDYLRLDDESVGAAIDRWQESDDAWLAACAAAFRRRALPKTLPLPAGPETAALRLTLLERAQELCARRGHRPDLAVWLDEATHVAYSEPDDDSAEGLWVRIRHQPLRRLGRVSFLLGELRNKRGETPRLLFPAELREDVIGIVEGLL